MKLLVVDANNLFWRSYHGLKKHLSNEDGKPTWAIHGTILTLARAVQDLKPTHLLVAFDGGVSAYRRGLSAEYKQSRKVHDDDLARSQMDDLSRLLRLLGVFIYQEPHVEADDIIATTVLRWQGEFNDIYIISGDKDFRQLIDWNVHVVKPSLGRFVSMEMWDTKMVIDHYGVGPSHLPEVWALSGDVSDEVSGVPGVGEKTAVKWLRKYGSLNMVLLSDEKKIVGYQHQVVLALQLVTLDGTIARCTFDLTSLAWSPTEASGTAGAAVAGFLDSLGLNVVSSRWRAGELWSKPLRRGRRLSQQKR